MTAMLCPHCSTAHSLPADADCPACGDSLGRGCYDCGHFFFELVEGVALEHLPRAEVCEECAATRRKVAAKEQRGAIRYARGDWQRDQAR